MACYVYVLRSRSTGRFYIGSTQDPARRLAEHNRGKVQSTRAWRPWDLVHCEDYRARAEAVGRERRLKSRRLLEELVARSAG